MQKEISTEHSFRTALEHHISQTGSLRFNELQEAMSKITGKQLSRKERSILTDIIHYQTSLQSSYELEIDDNEISCRDILILMAYSSDYRIGKLCETVNRMYASKHGYDFYCDTLPYDEILARIHPRTHCTWYKALLIRNLLNENFCQRKYRYICWIDSDAIVIDHDNPLETLIASCSRKMSAPDLIISSDLSTSSTCPINAGVMIVRTSDWSRSLWEDIWSHTSSARYHDVYFYEQSAIVKCLRLRGITPASLRPYDYAQQRGRYRCGSSNEGLVQDSTVSIRRVCVLPCRCLNSNRILAKPGELESLQSTNDIYASGLTQNRSWNLSAVFTSDESTCAEFIFHAVGQWNKMRALLTVAWQFKLLPNEILQHELDNCDSFRLMRGRCGGVSHGENTHST